MPTRTEVLATVVYPVTDVRGRAAERVRTWTHGQTLAPGRYRVVVASDGADPEQEQAVKALLRPHDELIRVEGARDTELWNAGVARAGTPWLVITEAHCLADPGCLEAAARWIAGGPAEVAGNFSIRHPEGYLLADLSQRWFDQIQARWRAPGEWRRLHRAGCVIRTDVFQSAGGFEPGSGQFAPPLLSARLHARGLAIGQVAGAAVTHVDSVRMWHHHADTADHVRGELDARAGLDPVFCERYFGHAPIWSNQLRLRRGVALVMARAVMAAFLVRPERCHQLAPRLPPMMGAAVGGLASRIGLHRLAVALDELAVERFPLPAAWRWSRFLRVHARVKRLAQLRWVRDRGAPPLPAPAIGRWAIETLGPDAIVGVHGLEEDRGRRFRWTEPVALLRLVPPPGDHELSIETGRLRGCPLDVVTAVVVGGRALPRALLAADDDGTLIVQLPTRWSARARDGIVLVCSPLAPARHGADDRRLLGLPILSVAVTPLRAGATSRGAAT